MVTIFRAHGLRVVIYLDDHEPAHVHVFGDGHAKINLIGPGDGPELVWVEGMKLRKSVRRFASLQSDATTFWPDGGRSMADLSDRIIDAALERGRLARETEPRAAAARYDAPARRVVVELTNGCTFTFPPTMAQGLEHATDAELEAIEILGQGFGLHWEALDVDLSLQGLMAGIFGTKAYMARRAGQVTSPAKAAASRINGAKGGRPRKSANG